MLKSVQKSETTFDEMQKILGSQKRASLTEGLVSNKLRYDRLERAVNVIKKNEEKFVDAMISDFGHRSPHQSRVSDIALSISSLRYAQKNLKRWRKSEKRSAIFPLNLLGAKARVDFQPLGVIGVINSSRCHRVNSRLNGAADARLPNKHMMRFLGQHEAACAA